MKLSYCIAPVILLTASASQAWGAQTGVRLKLSVPVVCTMDVQFTGEFEGSFRELCNVLDPYDAVLLHDTFDSDQNITLDYDGASITLDPSGRTELQSHPRGGLFMRDFRVSGAEADFVSSFRGEATTDYGKSAAE